MENEDSEDTYCINSLPDELITLILMNVGCQDILNFGTTCKRFNEIVNTDQTLWKHMYKNKLPAVIAELYQKHGDGDWLAEMKRYFITKKRIYSELVAMSPKYYLRKRDISLEDVRNFFSLALSTNLSYYYTVSILQEVVRKGQKNLEQKIAEKPYTLTEMHYAKAALRHLIQTFQALKWVKLHVNNELTPLIVINFFVQWVDTDSLHSDAEIENRICQIVKRVETLLDTTYPSKTTESVKERVNKGVIKERQVLDAINQILYHQPHMVVSSGANIDSLNVVKMLDTKCGNVIAMGAVYDAVAKRFGVNCDLIAFPNHLFLEWRDHADFRAPKLFTIDISTGVITPKRRCPFSQANTTSKYKYYPDSLLQYIYTTFHGTMGALRNWQTQNALHLLDFLGTDDNLHNPYRNFLPYLLDQTHIPGNISMNYLSTTHLHMLSALSNWNPLVHTETRERTVKRHDPSVRYAVGMICYHRRNDFVCIVRAWETTCRPDCLRRLDNTNLEFGLDQPFYELIAADQSDRYVAQENLMHVNRPSRLYHIEDIISREFTHYDGFAYVPNEEKRGEYPDDPLIIDQYRNRCVI